jgi:hypothetical protein
MKVIRVENFKTGQEYYASVNDDEMRLDPWGVFSDSLQTLTPSHKMSNVRISILKANVTPEAAAAEVIIQRRLNPNSIRPTKPANKVMKPVINTIPEVIEDSDSQESPINGKDFLKNKKGNTNV